MENQRVRTPNSQLQDFFVDDDVFDMDSDEEEEYFPGSGGNIPA
jgi:hypothetical protein